MRIRTHGKSIDFGGSIIGLSYYRIIDMREEEEEEEESEKEEEECGSGGSGGDFT